MSEFRGKCFGRWFLDFLSVGGERTYVWSPRCSNGVQSVLV